MPFPDGNIYMMYHMSVFLFYSLWPQPVSIVFCCSLLIKSVQVNKYVDTVNKYNFFFSLCFIYDGLGGVALTHTSGF